MEPDPGVVRFGIPLLAAAVSVLGVVAVGAAARRSGRPAGRWVAAAVAALAVWWAVLLAAAAAGLLARTDVLPPPFALVLGGIVAAATAVAASPVGRALGALPLWALVGFHSFRLPLELVMHEAARAGVMPPQMSYSGWNFDIVSGATALVLGSVAAFGQPPRAVLLAWNLLGSVLLATIVAIAVASTPVFQAFGSDPSVVNTWVLRAPYVLLPGVLVTAALAGHLVLWRRLLSGPTR